MNDPLKGLEGALTPEQFEILRADFQNALSRFFGELQQHAERWAAQSASPYRNRTWAAAYLQISTRKLDELIASGELPRKFVSTTPIVPVSALEELIARETVEANLRKFAKETANPPKK